MNKEELIELGVAEEVAEKVIEKHKNTIDGNYVTKTRFNEVNEENKTLRTQVAERDTQIKSLEEVDAESLKATIQQLQTDNEAKDQEYQAELKKLKVKNAAERQILEANARDLTSVLAHVDLSEADLNDDGTVQGLKDKLDVLKEEKTFLFQTDEPDKEEKKDPDFKGAQPGQGKKNDPDGNPDFSKMTYAEIDKYLSENKN